jgi:Alkylmercury lyase
VVFTGSAGDARRPSADRACGYINFFASAGNARSWARDHPEVTGTLLTRQGALSIGIAEFGTLLKAAPRPGADSDQPR